MTKILHILALGTTLTLLLSGCATKKPTLACFKGSTSCYTQQSTTVESTCRTCHAFI